MSYDILAALALFALVSSITPGPNNLMLLASGLNFGVRRSLPHMLGIACGFIVMILAVGAGISRLFDLWPPAHLVLKILSVAYLLYLAGRIARAGQIETGKGHGRPMTFLEAAAFQWVNPKAWAMALTATTVYMPEGAPAALLVVAAVFASVNLPSVGVWTWAGQALSLWLAEARMRRRFNHLMAFLLVLSLVPVLWPAG